MSFPSAQFVRNLAQRNTAQKYQYMCQKCEIENNSNAIFDERKVAGLSRKLLFHFNMI